MMKATTPSQSDPQVEAICAGQIDDDMTFEQRVWAVTSRIPAGRVATYGLIAQVLGGRAFRAVGQALHHNPYAPTVPCHRVVGHDGRLTGFAGGIEKKRKMLRAEGVTMRGDRVDLATVLMTREELAGV